MVVKGINSADSVIKNRMANVVVLPDGNSCALLSSTCIRELSASLGWSKYLSCVFCCMNLLKNMVFFSGGEALNDLQAEFSVLMQEAQLSLPNLIDFNLESDCCGISSRFELLALLPALAKDYGMADEMLA